MPGTKEIRVKIKSVQNTRKISKAMEMVAASKMRKAQERMRHARLLAKLEADRAMDKAAEEELNGAIGALKKSFT